MFAPAGEVCGAGDRRGVGAGGEEAVREREKERGGESGKVLRREETRASRDESGSLERTLENGGRGTRGGE